MKSQFIISAPNSNAGKTTITLGLLRLLKQKGIVTQPFKVGPDYIDPKFHQLASEKSGVNLDLYMMSKQEIENDLAYFGKDAQVNCIEGVMGLFDGAKKAERSTAELAKTIKTPVVFVVDAKAVAYSVAPLIQGFKNFDTDIELIGVIFNRVGSKSHYTFLQEACEDVGIQSLGYLRNIPDIQIPSRHLGLDIGNLEQFESTISTIADEMEQTVNWELLLKLTQRNVNAEKDIKVDKAMSSIRFAVAKDEAFNFTYQQTLKEMQTHGDVVYFSPLHDAELPPADFVYLPGGYPECYLEELSSNGTMLESIKSYADNGGKIFAECGGMMYLGKSIINKDSKAFEMVNYFDFSTAMDTPKLHLGYRTLVVNNKEMKGHEFHYSHIKNNKETAHSAEVLNARGKAVDTKIFKKKNVLASYIHIYLGNKETLKNIISEAKEIQ